MDQKHIKFYVTLAAILAAGTVWACNENQQNRREHALAELTACTANGGSWVQGRHKMQCIQGAKQ